MTGVRVRETVPDWLMQRVNEIVLADLTPEALQTRMRRGDIYPLDRTEKALGHFFQPGNLIALRELALQQVTRAVDRSLESYMEKEGLGKNLALRERIAVCVSSSPAAQYLIARAARMAQRIEKVHASFGDSRNSGTEYSNGSHAGEPSGSGGIRGGWRATCAVRAVSSSCVRGTSSGACLRPIYWVLPCQGRGRYRFGPRVSKQCRGGARIPMSERDVRISR